jgi:biopolymer transport protein ExbB
MWPLLVFSIITAGVTVERLIYLLSHNLGMEDLEQEIEGFVRRGDPGGAKAYLEKTRRRPGAEVLEALVDSSGLSENRMEKAAEAAALLVLDRLESGLALLAAFGSLAPLTGFLGTVSGMISAFRSLAQAAEVNPQTAAGGIYEALITTAFGLGIAIIALAAQGIFSRIADRFAGRTEKACADLITAVLKAREKR